MNFVSMAISNGFILEGTVIFTVGNGKTEMTYSMRIKDLMR